MQYYHFRTTTTVFENQKTNHLFAYIVLIQYLDKNIENSWDVDNTGWVTASLGRFKMARVQI